MSVIAAEPLNDDNSSKHNLGELSAFAENLDVTTELMFRKIQPIQRFLESRFASLERYVSFNVMFHSMSAETIKGLWFLPRNNHSRSQSHMRINTTACPVAVSLCVCVREFGHVGAWRERVCGRLLTLGWFDYR